MLGLRQYTSQIVHYTTFESEQDPNDLFDAVKTWVEQLQPVKVHFAPSSFKIKATVMVEGKELSFRAQVYRSDKENTSRVVELARMEGDGMQFRALFAQLKLQLE